MVRCHAWGAPAGFTRVEATVVVFIAVISLGLLSSCVQTVRTPEGRTQCTNNLREIGLAIHNFELSYKRMPPLFGGGTDLDGKPVEKLSQRFFKNNGAPQVFLLPFVEQDRLFDMVSHLGPNTFFGAIRKAVPTYVCPIDPGTVEGIQEGSHLGSASYTANGQLFGMTDSATGQPTGDFPWDRGSKIKDIKDGSANTIMFAHAYTRCGAVAGNDRTAASGAVWGYYNNGHAPSGTQGPPIFMSAPISGAANVGKDIKTTFQVQPKPHNTAACDPALPATPHGVMLVVLADGSVRNLKPIIQPLTWWQACSPDDGSTLPDNWVE